MNIKESEKQNVLNNLKTNLKDLLYEIDELLINYTKDGNLNEIIECKSDMAIKIVLIYNI